MSDVQIVPQQSIEVSIGSQPLAPTIQPQPYQVEVEATATIALTLEDDPVTEAIDRARPLVQTQARTAIAVSVESGTPLNLRYVMQAASVPVTEFANPATQQRWLMEVETRGQTVFSLPFPAVAPHLSELFINGIKAIYGLHFMLDGGRLEWRSPLALEPTDSIEIFYTS